MKKVLSFLLTCALGSGIFFTSVYAGFTPPTAKVTTDTAHQYIPQDAYMLNVGTAEVQVGDERDMEVTGFTVKVETTGNVSDISLSEGIIARINGKDIQGKTAKIDGYPNQFFVKFNSPVTLVKGSMNTFGVVVGEFTGPYNQTYSFRLTEIQTNGHVSGLPADIGVVNTTTYTLADAFMRQDTKRFNVYRGAVSATIGDFSLSNGSKSLLLNQLRFVDTKNNDLREIIQNVALVNKYSGTVVTYANVYKNSIVFENLNTVVSPYMTQVYVIRADIAPQAAGTKIQLELPRTDSVIITEDATGYRVNLNGDETFTAVTTINTVVSGEAQL